MPLTDPLRFAHSIMVGNLQFAATGSTLIPFFAQAHVDAWLFPAPPALPSLVFANCRLQWPLRLGLDQAAVQQAVSGLIDVAMLDKLWVMVIVGGLQLPRPAHDASRPPRSAGMLEPSQCLDARLKPVAAIIGVGPTHLL